MRLRLADGDRSVRRLRRRLRRSASREADEFYAPLMPPDASEDARRVQRQAFAGMLWSKQFYCYDVKRWLKGDPAQARRRRPSACAAATASGRISTTPT